MKSMRHKAWVPVAALALCSVLLGCVRNTNDRTLDPCAMTCDPDSYYVVICTTTLPIAVPDSTWTLRRFRLPDMNMEYARRIRLFKNADIRSLARWRGDLEHIAGTGGVLDHPVLSKLRCPQPSRERVPDDYSTTFVVGLSQDNQLIATEYYDPLSTKNLCDGYALFPIHDLRSKDIIASAEACLQDMDRGFSGFVAHAEILAHYLKADVALALEDPDAFMNHRVMSIRSNGVAVECNNLTANMICASPDGNRVLLTRLIPEKLVLEMRNADLSKLIWTSQRDLISDVIPHITWSDDCLILGVLAESRGQSRLDLLKSEDGARILSDRTVTTPEEAIGPILIGRKDARPDPFELLGTEAVQ